MIPRNIETYSAKIIELGHTAIDLVTDENGNCDPEDVQYLLDFTTLMHRKQVQIYIEKGYIQQTPQKVS